MAFSSGEGGTPLAAAAVVLFRLSTVGRSIFTSSDFWRTQDRPKVRTMLNAREIRIKTKTKIPITIAAIWPHAARVGSMASRIIIHLLPQPALPFAACGALRPGSSHGPCPGIPAAFAARPPAPPQHARSDPERLQKSI